MNPEYTYLNFLRGYPKWISMPPGCTNEEIDAVEKEWGVKLPVCFREMFLLAGKYFAMSFNGANDFRFSERDKMQDRAKRLAAERGETFMEDENIFVFSYYGPNAIFWFFRLNEGDDPPVYAYGDDTDGLEKMNDRLSDYIRESDFCQNYLRKTGVL